MTFPENLLNSSISHGTLRTQDLLPAFLDTLREVNPSAYAQLMLGPFGAIPSYAMEDDSSDWWNSEDAYWTLDDIKDALCEAAPEGFYFGAYIGDGSDFGFWADIELE